jgi:hypothetical protein
MMHLMNVDVVLYAQSYGYYDPSIPLDKVLQSLGVSTLQLPHLLTIKVSLEGGHGTNATGRRHVLTATTPQGEAATAATAGVRVEEYDRCAC